MKNNLIYYIMTYIMFLYPPFIYFMVMINFEDMNDRNQWIVGLITNVLFVLITTGILYVLAIKKRITKIENDEKSHFIFGYIGNVAVFLYTYQYLMGIERLVSVFSLVLLLVLAYKYLISKKITFKEVFLFSIVFGVLDYIIIIATGNTLFSETEAFTNMQSIIFQILFILVILCSICFYGFKLYKNHQWTILRYAFVSFLAIFLIIIYIDDTQEKLFATFFVLALFTWMIDLILRLIHKEFKVSDLVFYARIILLTIIIFYIHEMEIYRIPDFQTVQMGLLIGIFYVTGFSDILMHLSPKKQTKINLDLSIEDYIKIIYKPIISRYKDVLVISKQSDLPHELSSLGRDIIIKSNFDDTQHLDISAMSFVILYSDNVDDISAIKNQFPYTELCVISENRITEKKLKTCYTDFKYYIYTI